MNARKEHKAPLQAMLLVAATGMCSAAVYADNTVTLFGYLNGDIENVRGSGGAGLKSTWRQSNNLSF